MTQYRTGEPLPGDAPNAPQTERPSHRVAFLVIAVTLAVIAVALVVFLVWFNSRGAGAQITTSSATSTSVEAVATTGTIAETTTLVTSVSTTSTTAAPPSTTVTAWTGTAKWEKGSTSLSQAAAQLRKKLPLSVDGYLPARLPKGWALAAPHQPFGDVAAGYFDDMAANPWIQVNTDDPNDPAEYKVCFTNGAEVAGVVFVLGDWAETPFEKVTISGKDLEVYQDDTMVAVLVPGWGQGCVIGSPGARQAALEIAASLRVV